MEKLSKPLAASLVILVAFAGLAIEFNSITAKEKEPGYWEATLPMNYHAKDQLWFFFFTNFETKKLHWSTVTGPPNPLAVTFDVDYVKTTGSAGGAWDAYPWLDLYAEALRLKLGPDPSTVWVEVAADKATLDFDFHDPDPQGVVGTLIGHLTGKVKVLVNVVVPGIQLPAYENSEFTFKWTFVEPNYSVELSTYDLELPIGEPRTVAVTVKNTTKLSDMVRLQVDVEDLKKKEVEVRVQYDDGLFLPTTEGVTRDVTITAFADPMKKELPITGTIRISVDGNMMFRWPYDDRAHADLTVTVSNVPSIALDHIFYNHHDYTSPGWPGPSTVWYYLWGRSEINGAHLGGYYVFNVDLGGTPIAGETYTFTYTVHHAYRRRWSFSEPWWTITDRLQTHVIVGTPTDQQFILETHQYIDGGDLGSFAEVWACSGLYQDDNTAYVTEASIEFRGGKATITIPTRPSIHIEALTIKEGAFWTIAQAEVTIVDGDGNPASGATVKGCWSGLTSDVEFGGVTDSYGKVRFDSDYVPSPPSGSSYVFTVYEVAKSGYRYSPSQDTTSQVILYVP